MQPFPSPTACQSASASSLISASLLGALGPWCAPSSGPWWASGPEQGNNLLAQEVAVIARVLVALILPSHKEVTARFAPARPGLSSKGAQQMACGKKAGSPPYPPARWRPAPRLSASSRVSS